MAFFVLDRTKGAKVFMRVAILGFGTVGQAVARLVLGRHADRLRVTHVFNRGVARKKVDWMPQDVVWTEDPDAVLPAGPTSSSS